MSSDTQFSKGLRLLYEGRNELLHERMTMEQCEHAIAVGRELMSELWHQRYLILTGQPNCPQGEKSGTIQMLHPQRPRPGETS